MESDFDFYLHFEKSRGGGFVKQQIKNNDLMPIYIDCDIGCEYYNKLEKGYQKTRICV